MIFLNEKESLLINDIILSIYTTSDLRKMRKCFLESLQLLINYDSAVFDFCKYSENNISFFDSISINIEEEYLRKYREYYNQVDYIRWIFFKSNPIIYRDTDLVNNSIREKTIFFKEWMKPIGIYFGGGFSIICKGTLIGSVGLYRSKNSMNFSEKDLFILNLLNHYLSNRLMQSQQKNKKKHICKRN